MEILDIKDLTFCYPDQQKNAIENISFSLERGDFLALCGSTGSGKSTLARLIKRQTAPLGDLSGSIRINGRELSELSEREAAFTVGYVMQDPEQQIVTDKVWHELSFGLENMGLSNSVMQRTIAETASFFGIEDWFDKPVATLSGGQKQLLALASVMVMRPDILILDEPTSQLDPIAAAEFISTVCRLNRELSLTVIMIEHRLEDIVPVSNKLLALDRGRVVSFGETRRAANELALSHPALLQGMPAALRLYSRLAGSSKKEKSGFAPLTNTEGRAFIEKNFSNGIRELPKTSRKDGGECVLELSGVRFRYERQGRDILDGTDLKLMKGQTICVVGGNGSGKSTLLSLAAGVRAPYYGQVKVFGRKIKDYKNGTLYRECVSLLPQDVQTVFLKNSVREELSETGGSGFSELPIDLSELYDLHPYDLSGGQQQLVALSKVLMTKPKILMMDEPTKGLDAHTKNMITDLIGKLKERGTSLLIVTHDLEFAAECADLCAMLFRGRIVSVAPPDEFFFENNFYTTAVCRMTGGFYDRAITVDQAAKLCLMNEENDSNKE